MVELLMCVCVILNSCQLEALLLWWLAGSMLSLFSFCSTCPFQVCIAISLPLLPMAWPTTVAVGDSLPSCWASATMRSWEQGRTCRIRAKVCFAQKQEDLEKLLPWARIYKFLPYFCNISLTNCYLIPCVRHLQCLHLFEGILSNNLLS